MSYCSLSGEYCHDNLHLIEWEGGGVVSLSEPFNQLIGAIYLRSKSCFSWLNIIRYSDRTLLSNMCYIFDDRSWFGAPTIGCVLTSTWINRSTTLTGNDPGRSVLLNFLALGILASWKNGVSNLKFIYAHQFNMRLHHFSQFLFKKLFQEEILSEQRTTSRVAM